MLLRAVRRPLFHFCHYSNGLQLTFLAQDGEVDLAAQANLDKAIHALTHLAKLSDRQRQRGDVAEETERLMDSLTQEREEETWH